MKTYIVQLENGDDIILARDKISWGKARRVLLVWPRHGRVLERRVDLLQLMRHCQQIGAQMAIVTDSGEVKYQARSLGIPVYKNPERAQQAVWRTSPAQRRTWRVGKQPPSTQALRQHQELFTQSKAEPTILARHRWLRLVVFTMAVLSFLLLALSFAPEARVSLAPVRQTQELVLTMWASPEILEPNPSGGVPAHPLSVEVEGHAMLDSSSRALVPDQVASGKVLLHNLTDQAVQVPQGSIVLTNTSPTIRYVTTQPVVVLPGATAGVPVPIQAIAPGRAGNAGPGMIRAMEGPLGLRLLVDNPQAVTGGSDRSSPAPSQEDSLRLREKLLADLQKTALEELNGQLLPRQRLLKNSLHMRSVIYEDQEPDVGSPAERLQMTMRVLFEGWYIEEEDLNVVAGTILDASLPENFQPVPDSLQVDLLREEDTAGGPEDPLPGSVHWEVALHRLIESSWAEGQLVQAIQGRRVEDAVRILEDRLLLAQTPRIVLSPAWWGRLPFLPVRIALVKQ